MVTIKLDAAAIQDIILATKPERAFVDARWHLICDGRDCGEVAYPGVAPFVVDTCMNIIGRK